MAVKATLSESSFDGELQAAFDGDPFNIGHGANGAVQEAFASLRRAAKAAAEQAGKPQPAEYQVEADVQGGAVKASFNAS